MSTIHRPYLENINKKRKSNMYLYSFYFCQNVMLGVVLAIIVIKLDKDNRQYLHLPFFCLGLFQVNAQTNFLKTGCVVLTKCYPMGPGQK